MCLIFFIDYGLFIPPMSSRPSSRLCVPWGVSSCLSGRLSLLARIVLIRLVSRLVGRLVSRLVLLARLVLLVVVSRGRLVLSPCLRPSVSSYHLAGASCLLVSFLFHSSFSSCLADLDRAFLRGGACSHINPIGMRSVSLWLVRSLLARHEVVMRYPWPSCVIRP